MPLTPRLRKFLDLPILRCRCRRCLTFFTFLPLFVAPGKWYSYPAIEEALLFVSDSRHATSSDGLRALDHRRDDRLDDGDSPGPSETTVRRWRQELSQQVIPWQQRAEDALVNHGESSPERQRPAWPPIRQKPLSGGDLLFLLFCFLGTLVSRNSQIPLGVGLWFLESRFGQRCLAMPALAGRLIPCPCPSLAVTPPGFCVYPPEPSKPP